MLRRLFLAGLLALLPTLGQAQDAGFNTLNGPAPFWVLRGQGVAADLDFDFANGRYYQKGIAVGLGVGNLLTTSRASTKYCNNTAGIWASVAANVLCVTNKGALIEEARTNDALWSRDMTNAAWVKVGMGTALNAVGIDGTANSATTLTATGTASSCVASCTALQTITLGSSADTYSVWLKRVSGSGAVNITINNLVGTTACTLSSSVFTLCQVTATLANPVFGIQMAGLNDVIIADFNQTEPGVFATSPILTTTVAVTRAADASSVLYLPNFGTGISIFASSSSGPNAPDVYGSSQVLVEISNGSTNRVNLLRGTTGVVGPGGAGGTLSTIQSWMNGIAPGTVEVSAPFRVASHVGSSGAVTLMTIGNRYDGTAQANMIISEVAVWPVTGLASAVLQRITVTQ